MFSIHLMAENANKLVRSLQNRLEEKIRLASIVTHDLRNPLASIRMYFEMALSDNPALCKHSESMREPVLNMCQNMSLLLDNYSDLVKVEADCERFERLPCDLARLVREARDSCSDMIVGAGTMVWLSADAPDFPVSLDIGLFSKMLHKLLGDLIMLTPKCSAVDVKLRRNGHNAILGIEYVGAWTAAELQSMLDIDLINLKEERDSERRFQCLVFAIIKKILAAHEFEFAVEPADGNSGLLNIQIPCHELSLL